MERLTEIFSGDLPRRETTPGVYSEAEVGLANRNHGLLLEMMVNDVTPTGAHYLLNHFDVPFISPDEHRLSFAGAFDNPYVLTLEDILALPQTYRSVVLECAGNGRRGVLPRNHSMPWGVEAAGCSEWTGTPLWPLIERAAPQAAVVEVSFTGADEGFDGGHRHAFGRSLTLEALHALDVMLVTGMNGAPILPQHGAPLRIIVPGWYGMASVKWLTEIRALIEPYQGYQQVGTYRLRQSAEEPGAPVGAMKVKSLMIPPGVPDWSTRARAVNAGVTRVSGRAWSGSGRAITRVEFGVDGHWQDALVEAGAGPYAWSKWFADWEAEPGEHVLECRATDSDGHVQPLEPDWNLSGFCNNSTQKVRALVIG